MSETESSNRVSIVGLAGILGLVAAVSVGAIALGSSTPAAAEGLERFASCEALQSWSTDVAPVPPAGGVISDGGPVTSVASGAAPMAADAATANESAGGAARDSGGTNTVVEGVDEIDVIDRVGDDRLLVTRNGILALVGLSGRTVVAQQDGLPYDARISVANGLIWVAGSSLDGTGTDVRRVRIDGDSLTEDGRWHTPGYLVDARRTGDTLHVVAVDYPATGAAPFAGGPVPCDQVWRPVAPSQEAAATLVASLPGDGELTPTAATEVTGSAGNLLVTDDAVFVATQNWAGDGTVTTGIHRFELAGLTLTGSGVVPGTVAGPFAMDEHDGHLRVATNATSGFTIPVEGDVIVNDAAGVADAPETTVPTTDGTDVSEASLAEVLVLDTDGDLDVVGDTGRFGHDGETIQGIRFVGDTAYVVTYLQTDPFWVIDLADPTAPHVVGELQIPGFSGYLHPVADGEVVGIGPDGNGTVSARLFDVSDPQDPSVLDEVTLGDDSPATWDYHSFVPMDDGHFAVPSNDYPTYVEVGECEELLPPDAAGTALPTPTTVVPPNIDPGTPIASDPAEPLPGYCPQQPVGGAIGAVELQVADGHLVEVDRASVERPDASAERVVRTPDGTWLVLSWDRLIPTDGGDDLVLPTSS